MVRSSPMHAPRSRRWRNAKESGCARSATRKRSIPWVVSSRPLPAACRSAARSSRTRPASNLRFSKATRGASSDCACAACRPRPARRAAVMREIALFRVQAGARIDSPLCRLADGLARLFGWRRHGLAFVLGVGAAAALPPVDLTPLLVVVFPGLLWLDDGSAGLAASFRLGWVFGFGFFLAGLYWIAAALFVDIGRFWWLVPFAAAGLPAGFALYIGLTLLVTRLVGNSLHLPPTARIFAFAIAWSAAEWVRGHALTGLPWNLIGYAWSGGFPGSLVVLQSVAWVGIYGLSFVTILAASLPAALGMPSIAPISAARRWAPAVAAGLLILVPAIAGAIRLETIPTILTGTWLRLVQPSIPQSLKWQPAAAQADFRRLLDLSGAPAAHQLAAVLWPEAASPFLLDRDAAARRAIAT